MPTILVTNDDGIGSPGLKAAVEAVLPLGKVIVVAPTSQQTSTGRGFRGDKSACLQPVEYLVNNISVEAYHLECTPARVVLHAFDVLFYEKKPDLAVSGINYGENLGTNVTISGTIGAILQSASCGVRGLAASLQTKIEDHRVHSEQEWGVAIHFTQKFARQMLERALPPDVDILNVNVPAAATAKTEAKWARISRQPYFGNKIQNPTKASKVGDARCFLAYDVARLEPDSDIRAILDGYVSVAPMSMDLTSRIDIAGMDQAWK